MKTVIKIAWRNVWRNKMRSGVVFASIVMGVWAGLFTVSLTLGMMDQQKRTILNTQTSHLKIHTDTYVKDEKLVNRIPSDEVAQLEEFLSADDRVKSFSLRTVSDGTLSNAHGFSNLKIVGVDPEQEKTVTTIYERLDTGFYFQEYKNNPVLIGRGLIDDLNINVGKSVNLNFMSVDTLSVSIGFKVEGIFNSGSGMNDKGVVYVERLVLNQVLGTDDYIHEVAIMCHDLEDAADVANAFNEAFPDLEARTWIQLSPQLAYQDEMMTTSILIILVIIIFALAFGILNTMLMAVLERKRELGMLLCVGMNKFKVFTMIMFETIFLSFAAAPIGLLLSWISVSYFGKYGLNLGSVEDAMYQFGYDTMVYTKLEPFVYIAISAMIIMAAIISSIIPARKALKYNPAEAVRAL